MIIASPRVLLSSSVRLSSLAIPLALLAVPALASPPPTIVGLGPDLITVLTKPPVRDRASGVFKGAELQGEVTSDSVAAVNGWRSMHAVIDISCPDRRDRVRAMTVFSEHNTRGVARDLTPPADWIAPEQNTSYGLAVVKYFCGAGAHGVAHAASRPAAGETATPTPPYAHMAAIPSPSPAPAARPSEPPAEPPAEPEPSDVTTNGLGAAYPPPPPPPERKTPPAQTPAPRPARSVRPTSGPFAVQVGSTTAEGDAKAILDHLRAAHPGVFTAEQTKIEAAEVHGQRHYRAVIVGFADAAQAAGFCAALHAGPTGCIVRKAP
jgi:cell division septation protein DedD